MAAPIPVRAMNSDRLKIFTGSANPRLAEELCGCLGIPLGKASVRQFADGEIYLQIQENVRGADVFVVQPTCTPVDRNLMELLRMIDALKRSSAQRITAVLPYYGYARQDRKDKPRVPISAKLVASLIERAGADRILALGRGPGASLSPAVPVDLPRPRLSDLMNHNQSAVRIRAQLGELLTGGCRARETVRVNPKMVPVEA